MASQHPSDYGPDSSVQEWELPHYFVVVGVAFIVYQSIGWVGWLADGPEQLVKYRDPNTISYVLCRVFEFLAIVTAITVGYPVIRACIRERTLTFDAMFCLACVSLYWQDPLANFFQPLFLWSQNWVNLNDWVGYLPFSPNPDAGRSPEPIIMDGLNYLAAWLGFAIIINSAMDAWKKRFPRARAFDLVLLAFVIGSICDLVLEAPMYYFDLWQFPGSPDIGIWADTGHKFPAYEIVSGAIMFSLVASIRYFKDENGLTLLERGLERHTPGVRKFITTLAMVGLFNAAYLADNSVYWFLGTHSGVYKDMPAHIVAGHCDAPGTTGTRYGPCPGSEGYKMPMLGSLPGEVPAGNDKWLNGVKQCEECEPVRVNGEIVPGANREDR